MRNTIVVEDIESMRLRQGIDDVELREKIRDLQVGDLVKLTFLAGPHTFETLTVRITRIRGLIFCGKLANRATFAGLSKLRVGSSVTFTAAHIHSLPRKPATHE